MNDFIKIQELLKEKADCQARLNLMPYDGSPEIKEQSGKNYLYVRKRAIISWLFKIRVIG